MRDMMSEGHWMRSPNWTLENKVKRFDARNQE